MLSLKISAREADEILGPWEMEELLRSGDERLTQEGCKVGVVTDRRTGERNFYLAGYSHDSSDLGKALRRIR